MLRDFDPLDDGPDDLPAQVADAVYVARLSYGLPLSQLEQCWCWHIVQNAEGYLVIRLDLV